MKRITRQRQEIRRVIEQATRPLGPREILLAGRQRIPSLSVATVYRNLRELQKDEVIVCVSMTGHGPVYALRKVLARHHHHFLCTSCRRVFEIDAHPGALSVSLPAGFLLERQEVRLYGECADCRGREPGP